MMTLDELKELQEKIIIVNRDFRIYNGILDIMLFTDIFALLFFAHSGIKLFICLFALCITILIISVVSIIEKTMIDEKIDIFKKEYKRIFVVETLKDYFTDIRYEKKNSLFEGIIINNLNVKASKYRTSSNDYISGRYKNISFRQTDVKIEELKENGDDRYWHTIFCGKVLTFDFDKSIKTNIRIVNKAFPLVNDKEPNIKVEDITFNEINNIYAEDEHDAFYILTPTFLEKLSLIKGEYMLDFRTHELFIAINNIGDSFEWSVFKKIDEKQIKEMVIRDITKVTDIIDYFGTEDKIWNNY